jgi:hypothetical protein
MRRNVPEYARCINSSSDFLMNCKVQWTWGVPNSSTNQPAVREQAPACLPGDLLMYLRCRKFLPVLTMVVCGISQ